VAFLRDANIRRAAGNIPDATINDISKALLIQETVIEALPESISGWKVAKTPESEVIWGAIFAYSTYRDLEIIPRDDTNFVGIEAEIAYRAIADIQPREDLYTREELAKYLQPLPVIEIVKSRYKAYESATTFQRVADRMSSGGLVVGGASMPEEKCLSKRFG
jgi:2-keto-4-pentenoate hydratase